MTKFSTYVLAITFSFDENCWEQFIMKIRLKFELTSKIKFKYPN